MELHAKFGPIASFWWGKIFTVSIASAELFDTQKDLFDRPGKKPIFEYRDITDTASADPESFVRRGGGGGQL